MFGDQFPSNCHFTYKMTTSIWCYLQKNSTITIFVKSIFKHHVQFINLLQIVIQACGNVCINIKILTITELLSKMTVFGSDLGQILKPVI